MSKNEITHVYDFSKYKKERLKMEKRKTERILLDKFIGVYVLIEEKGLKYIKINDISKSGMSFLLPENAGSFKPNEILTVRLYLNQNYYFVVPVEVKHCREEKIDGVNYYKHGCTFFKELASYKTVYAFVSFIQAIAGNLKEDKGDLKANLF